MKTRKKIIILLMLLPLIIDIIALQFLPAKVPMHYSFDGTIDRWGSKYEILVICAISIIFGIFFLIISKFSSKQEENGTNNEKIFDLANSMMLIVINALNIYTLILSFKNVENLSSLSIEVEQLTFLLVGFTFIPIGNILPKARMNSLIGLRTSWSMKNENTWKKSQRFGGISFIITGFLMMIIALLTTRQICAIANISLLTVSVIIQVIYTYIVAKKEKL